MNDILNQLIGILPLLGYFVLFLGLPVFFGLRKK